MLIKSRCIVLHRFPYSDSSWIAKALTEESGVVSFIIKGGKRKESPFKGALDPLSLSEVVFNQNLQKTGSSDLTFIKEATLLDWHSDLRNNLLSQAIAQVMAEIVLRYAPQGIPLQDEFSLLCKALDSLNQENPSENIFAQWLLEISDLWGYHLDLDICSRCEKNLTEAPADFFPESGGIICKSCQGIDSSRAKPETLQGLWDILQGKQKITGRFFVENALLAYLRNHIGFLKEIHSLQYLQEIRKLCSPQTT